jgi:hypothetical protein
MVVSSGAILSSRHIHITRVGYGVSERDKWFVAWKGLTRKYWFGYDYRKIEGNAYSWGTDR